MKNHLHSHHNEVWTGTPSTTTRPVAQEGRLTQERNPALDSQHTPLLTRLRSFIESKSTGGVEASDITLAWSTPTASAIPSGAMEVFSRVLGEVFACNSPGFPIGAAVAFLTKGCLCRLDFRDRDTTLQPRSVASSIKARVSLLKNGEFERLWEDQVQWNAWLLLKRDTVHKNIESCIEDMDPKDAAKFRRRVAAFASKGNLSKAARACAPTATAVTSDETFTKLEALHPEGPSIEDLMSIKDGQVEGRFIRYSITTEELTSMVLDDFNAGVAPGPDGLRAEHIRQLIEQKNCDRRSHFTKSLALYLNSVLVGKLSPIESAIFASARLIALQKDDKGGIRPIAIGSHLRRLATKFAVRKVMLATKDTPTFLPEQVGIGVKSPCEALIHAVNFTFENNPDSDTVGLMLDATNAFNLADRSNFLTLVRDSTVLRPIFALAFLLYGYQPSLYAEGFGKKIASKMGTMQGCPLGNFLFCVGLQPLAQAITEKFPSLIVNGWLADDGNIFGPRQVVQEVYQFVKAEGPKYGYILNDRKSMLYAPAINFEVDNMPEFPQEIHRICEKGTKMLGGIVSTDPIFVKSFIVDKLVQNSVALSNCALLENAQVSYLLLRFCLGLPKYQHLFRTTPPGLSMGGAVEVDKVI